MRNTRAQITLWLNLLGALPLLAIDRIEILRTDPEGAVETEKVADYTSPRIATLERLEESAARSEAKPYQTALELLRRYERGEDTEGHSLRAMELLHQAIQTQPSISATNGEIWNGRDLALLVLNFFPVTGPVRKTYAMTYEPRATTEWNRARESGAIAGIGEVAHKYPILRTGIDAKLLLVTYLIDTGRFGEAQRPLEELLDSPHLTSQERSVAQLKQLLVYSRIGKTGKVKRLAETLAQDSTSLRPGMTVSGMAPQLAAPPHHAAMKLKVGPTQCYEAPWEQHWHGGTLSGDTLRLVSRKGEIWNIYGNGATTKRQLPEGLLPHRMAADGKTLLTFEQKLTRFVLYDLETEKERHSHGAILPIGWTPFGILSADTNRLWTLVPETHYLRPGANDTGSVKMHLTSTPLNNSGPPVVWYRVGADPSDDIVPIPDGKSLFVRNRQTGRIQIWNLDPERLGSLAMDLPKEIGTASQVAFSQNGEEIFLTNHFGDIRLIRPKDSDWFTLPREEKGIAEISARPDGALLAIATPDGELAIHGADPRSPMRQELTHKHEGGISSIQFVGNGKFLLTLGRTDGKACLTGLTDEKSEPLLPRSTATDAKNHVPTTAPALR